ncbi:YtxH domain-containing protein [Lacibacter sp. H375]|uniref:YtxH domain-containing protein n=1 Tax=Lacibacter sp. H375 TaxID=3133424 RepID=UPI0030C0BE68
MSTGKIVSAVLAGVAVGAVLGILFAPDKGSATRNAIAKGSKDLVDGLGDKANEFMGSITEKFESAKDEAQRLAEKGKHKAEQLHATIQPRQNS